MNNKPRDPVRLDIQIEVDAEALQKLWLYVDLAQGEVSVLGLAEEIIDPTTKQVTALRVTDFFLVKQRSSSAETEMEPDGIVELMASGIDPSKLRCWAHSHGTMQVFWSGQDSECIEGLANDGWLLSLVVNKKRETMMRLDIFHPTHLFLEDIAFQVHYSLPEEVTANCLKEFHAKVIEPGWMSVTKPFDQRAYLGDLHQCQQAGLLTAEELQEEILWMGYEAEEVPF